MKGLQRRFRWALVVALITTVAVTGMAAAQALSGLQTSFTSSITYMNLSNQNTTVTFNFYPVMDGTGIERSFPLAANAGASLFLGSGDANLPGGFSGSATMAADVPLAAVAVQVPQESEVRNRPLSNGFTSGQASSEVLLATILKNQFGQTTKFSVQNAGSQPVNINIAIYNADNPAAAPIQVSQNNIPPGAAQAFDARTLSELSGFSSFNGSAIVTASHSDNSPGSIVASVTELGIPEHPGNRLIAVAFEGVNDGGTNIFMATALCDVFNGQTTSYAVQNISQSDSAQITVNFTGVNVTNNAPMNGSIQRTVGAGAKTSIIACDADGIGPNFNGAATVSSSQELVVVGKLFGSRNTAFLGETSGSSRLSLPYVRWSPDEQFTTNTNFQRGFIAIQNIGTSTVNNVAVEYRDVLGGLVGTHTIGSIEPGAKANSRAIDVTQCTTPGDTSSCPTAIQFFGNPQGNPEPRFGGAVVIVGPANSELIAIVRIETGAGGPTVAEDYNATHVAQ